MQETAFDQNHMRYDHNDRRGTYILANHLQGQQGHRHVQPRLPTANGWRP